MLLSNKPEKALDCLKEISGPYRTRAVFWYRMAQCYSCIYQRELEKGRLNMVSDVVVSEQRQKLYLPAKAVYKFQEQEEPEKEDPIEQATKCLRNALSFCDDQELRVYILLLLSYICMNKQPQCTLTCAQQLLHMDVSDSQRFIASLYASEALLALDKPRQAIEYLSNMPKELKLLCHSTLSPTAAVFPDECSSLLVQSINLTCAQLHMGNLPLAVKSLNSAMSTLGLTQTQPQQRLTPVPAPILSLAVYIALKLGNHKQAETIIRTRHVYAGYPFDKPSAAAN